MKSKAQGRPLLAIVTAIALAGCHAQRPNVAGEIARLSGVDHAIVFHETAEPVDLPATSANLPIAQVVRLTLLHDPRIQSAMAKVRAAEADANQARLLPNPILGVDVRSPTTGGSNLVVEATLGEDLIAILQKPATIKAADFRLRAAASDAITTTLDVIAEVQTTYSTARAVASGMAIAQRRHEILQHLRDIAQKRLDLGDATRLEVLTLDTQLLQASLDLADLRLTHTEQRLTLARLIGQPGANLDWQLSSWEMPPDVESSESVWIDAALHNRPEIRAKIWELGALGEDLSAANLAAIQGGEIGIHAEHDPEWRVGPTLTIPLPIFDFGQATRAKIDALRIAARHDLLLQRRTVIQEVRLAYATYVETRRMLSDVADKLVPLQQKQLDQAQRAYQAGDTDLTMLLLAQTDSHLAASRIVDLQEKLTLARIKLERAAGGAAIASRIHNP